MLDALAVFLSVIGIILNPPKVFGSTSAVEAASALSALRSFRLTRMLKLFFILSKDERFEILLNQMLNAIQKAKYYGIILFIFLYAYAIIGMQYFANKFRFDSHGMPIRNIGSADWVEAPQISTANFDTFTNAVIAVFQILTLDFWGYIFADIYRVVGPVGVLYSHSLVAFGTYFLMNLFFAIILDDFCTFAGIVATIRHYI